MNSLYLPGDFPANPVEKEGYRLEFQEEFDGSALNPRRWLPYYLPHWSSRERSKPSYAFEGSNLVLQITEDQQPWCPEFDGEVKCSSIQTGLFAGPPGTRQGQHRFNSALIVREAQNNVRLYAPQYGYFECRARAVRNNANHVALWMIGYEDSPERCGELAIFEIMGEYIHSGYSRVGHGIRAWGDKKLKDAFYDAFFALDATHFHIYAVEWLPDHLDFFIDNMKVTTIHQSPDYPMQFMLSIYELPGQENRGDPYPKKFMIDYIRGYQPVRGEL